MKSIQTKEFLKSRALKCKCKGKGMGQVRDMMGRKRIMDKEWIWDGQGGSFTKE